MSFLDPFGLDVIASSSEEQQTILDMIPEEDREFVAFDENGNIDKSKMNSHSSKSSNYQKLKYLVNDDRKFLLKSCNSIQYKNDKGDIVTDNFQGVRVAGQDEGKLSYFTPSTREVGFTGYTFVPGNNGWNSPDNNVYIYINPNLSRLGKAETGSHEMLAHAYLFAKNLPSDHNRFNGLELNIILKIHIIKAMQETRMNNGVKP